MTWLQISGTVHALAARRGDERGSYLWIDAGTRSEAVVAELFLPAVDPDRLDGAIGVAVGSVQVGGAERTGDVALEFGRVRDGRGVLSASGAGLDTDISFELSRHPRSGGFCSHCGGALDVSVVQVITPPDGGVIGRPDSRCSACGAG